jgi:NUMOD4 motif
MVIKQQKLRKLEDEDWRVLPESNGRYLVSNYGRIKSFSYNKKDGQIMKCYEIKGYKIVPVNLNKLRYKFYVHKLVAQIWIPKPSDEHIFVTHLDGNLKNNHVSNLEWHTKNSIKEKHRELIKLKTGSYKRSRNINHSKLKERDIKLLKTMLQKGLSQSIIAKMFCISGMQVSRIKRGENWGHVQP